MTRLTSQDITWSGIKKMTRFVASSKARNKNEIISGRPGWVDYLACGLGKYSFSSSLAQWVGSHASHLLIKLLAKAPGKEMWELPFYPFKLIKFVALEKFCTPSPFSLHGGFISVNIHPPLCKIQFRSSFSLNDFGHLQHPLLNEISTDPLGVGVDIFWNCRIVRNV